MNKSRNQNDQGINYIEVNRKSWNNRIDTHIESGFYDHENFLKGKSSLNEIEVNLLGDNPGINFYSRVG